MGLSVVLLCLLPLRNPGVLCAFAKHSLGFISPLEQPTWASAGNVRSAPGFRGCVTSTCSFFPRPLIGGCSFTRTGSWGVPGRARPKPRVESQHRVWPLARVSQPLWATALSLTEILPSMLPPGEAGCWVRGLQGAAILFLQLFRKSDYLFIKSKNAPHSGNPSCLRSEGSRRCWDTAR